MLYKHVLGLYRGTLPEAGRVIPGGLQIRDDISARLEIAMPFVLNGEALELVRDLAPESYSEEIILERLRDFRLPHPMSWIEHEYRSEETFERLGALIRGGDQEPFMVIPFLEANGMFYEPFCMLVVDHAKNQVSLGINHLVLNAHIEHLFDLGLDRDEAVRKMEEGKQIFAEIAAMSVVHLRDAVELMGAKNAPMDGRREPLMSRQERRALARKGEEPPEAGAQTTRIVLNAEGRAHLAAMRETSEGRPRRAHWVRGHLMRTPTKGPVWRSAHVRGFGDPVMSPRLVITAPEGADDPTPSP